MSDMTESERQFDDTADDPWQRLQWADHELDNIRAQLAAVTEERDVLEAERDALRGLVRTAKSAHACPDGPDFPCSWCMDVAAALTNTTTGAT